MAIIGAAEPIAHPWHAQVNRADPGHDRALGQVAMAHQPLPPTIGALIGVRGEEAGNLKTMPSAATPVGGPAFAGRPQN
jgi:hypothetical protein